MLNRRLAMTFIPFAALWLAGCSKEDAKRSVEGSSQNVPLTPAAAWDALAASAKGFTAGTLMSAHTVYVLFDPQCPHCSHLWEASLPLHNRVKFVWVPVAIIGPKSLPQGAALLQAPLPIEAMTAHEKSLLSGGGGTSASASVPSEIEAAIKANTELLNRLGADSVPFIVARQGGNGQVVTRAGALETAALTEFLGLR